MIDNLLDNSVAEALFSIEESLTSFPPSHSPPFITLSTTFTHLLTMKTFEFILDPLMFTIESDCDTPLEALAKELGCSTEKPMGILAYLHQNIEDYPTLNESIECVNIYQD